MRALPVGQILDALASCEPGEAVQFGIQLRSATVCQLNPGFGPEGAQAQNPLASLGFGRPAARPDDPPRAAERRNSPSAAKHSTQKLDLAEKVEQVVSFRNARVRYRGDGGDGEASGGGAGNA